MISSISLGGTEFPVVEYTPEARMIATQGCRVRAIVRFDPALTDEEALGKYMVGVEVAPMHEVLVQITRPDGSGAEYTVKVNQTGEPIQEETK